ncbi:MAG: MAPEG family protein [Wenzhouxiangellaceae bacterium]
MNPGLMFLPCLAMLLLTAGVLFIMFRGRQRAVRAGEISAVYFKTYDTGETLPRKVKQADRCYHNLLESTPLFYMVCLAVMALGQTNIYFIAAAWVYVLIRLLQCYVHLTSNKIGPRSQLFMISWLLLIVMAIALAVFSV